jgi:hypothetical protein
MEVQPIINQFKWNLNNLSLYMGGPLFVDSLSLNGAKIQLHIDWYGIRLYCKDIGQNEEVKFTAKFWVENNGSKFNEYGESYFKTPSFT